jgi:penicillin-binding protein 1A
MPDVPSLSLGTGLVTPLDLTAAYAMFPNGGLAVRPRGIATVVDADGSTAFEEPVHTERVISADTAYQMVSMLSDVIDRGTGAAARSQGVKFPAGGKTGTTSDFKDAWFVGFSSSVVVGVWVGFDQPKTIGREAYGAKYALPIWSDFMRRSSGLRAPKAFARPADLREVSLCRVSYLRPVDGCPVYTEYLKKDDDEPTRLCPIHKGSVKQRLQRTMESFFSGLKRRVLGVFK